MAKFQITGPDGAKYEIQAPDMDSAMAAASQFFADAPGVGSGGQAPTAPATAAEPPMTGADVASAFNSPQPPPSAAPQAPSPAAMAMIDQALAADDGGARAASREKWHNTGQFLGKAAEGFTGGIMGDEAAALLDATLGRGRSDSVFGPDQRSFRELYDDRKQHYSDMESQYSAEHPVAALGADILGAGASAFTPVGAIGALRKGGLGLRALASAGAGAGFGGLYGAMEGDETDAGRLGGAQTGATVGAALGAALPAVGGLVQNVVNRRTANQAVARAAANAPSPKDAKAITRGLYNQVRDAGVEVSAARVAQLRDDIVESLLGGSAYSRRPGAQAEMPATHNLVRDLSQTVDEMRAAGNVNPGLPFMELEGIRRQAGNAAGSRNYAGDRLGGMIAKSQIDDMVRALSPDDVVQHARPRPAGNAAGSSNYAGDRADLMIAKSPNGDMVLRLSPDDMLPALSPGDVAQRAGAAARPDDVVAGDPTNISDLILAARAAHRNSARSIAVDELMRLAETYKSGETSGIKNRVAVLLRSEGKNFSNAERQLALKIVHGESPAEYVADLFGSRMGNAGAGLIGGAVGTSAGPLGGLVGAGAGVAAGYAARKIMERAVRKKTQTFRDVIANGGINAIPEGSPAMRRIIEALGRREASVIGAN